jgi:hypothetical protein
MSSDLFRAEALAARRAVAGPGRLLPREPLGRWWLLLAGLLAGGLIAAWLVQVPVYSAHVGSHHHLVYVRTGSEPLLRFLWRQAT